jgi:hypothetical protein
MESGASIVSGVARQFSVGSFTDGRQGTLSLLRQGTRKLNGVAALPHGT